MSRTAGWDGMMTGQDNMGLMGQDEMGWDEVRMMGQDGMVKKGLKKKDPIHETNRPAVL